MRKGEISLIRCSSDYAFGNTPEDETGFDPGTSLDFEVELVDWSKQTDYESPENTLFENIDAMITCGDIHDGKNSNSNTEPNNYNKINTTNTDNHNDNNNDHNTTTNPQKHHANPSSDNNTDDTEDEQSLYILIALIMMITIFILFCCFCLKQYYQKN